MKSVTPENKYARRGAIMLLVVAAFVAVAISGVHRKLFAGHKTEVRAVFADTLKLRHGDPVRVDGLQVGKVEDLKVDPGARSTTVTMALDSSAPALHRDARADIQWKTLLGSAFFLELDPGSSDAGSLPGLTIPLKQTQSQVELDNVTAIVKNKVKSGLQTMAGELSDALSNPTALSGTLSEAVDAAPSLTMGLKAIRGQRPDRDLRRVISATADVTSALDTPTRELQTTLEGTATLLETTARRRAELADTVSRAPGVLDRTDLTLDGLDTTLALADPLVAKLLGPAPEIGPTADDLRPTLVAADRLLTNATPLLAALRPAVQSLATASSAARPLVNRIRPSITRLSRTILPYVNEVDPISKHTTAEMIGPTMAGLGSGAGGQMDANGRFIRFPATSGSTPAYLPCNIYINNPDKQKQIECDSLQDALTQVLSSIPPEFNPQP